MFAVKKKRPMMNVQCAITVRSAEFYEKIID